MPRCDENMKDLEIIDIPGYTKYKLVINSEKREVDVISFQIRPEGYVLTPTAYTQKELGYNLWEDGTKTFFPISYFKQLKKDFIMNTDNVKREVWIVGSVCKTTDEFSVSRRPVVHDSKALARAEAERLAHASSSKKFVVLKVEGTVEVKQIVWS
jgi:hypothetical protein